MNDATESPEQASTRRGLSSSAILMATLAVSGVIIAVVLIAAFAFGDDTVEVLQEREVGIELKEFEIFPSVIDVGPGTDLTFVIDNVGGSQHDLQISSNTGTERIKPGESETLEAGVVKESYTIWCSIKGHREAGMESHVQLVSAAA